VSAEDPTTGGREPFEIDTEKAHAARVYNYLLGGRDNFAVDRALAATANEGLPGGLDGARANVRANRDFLGRAVRWLVGEAGVRQFLDIGTGIPDGDNVHAVAQTAAPECQVVCVDSDPVVLAHAHTLIRSTPEGRAAFVSGDLRDPDDIWTRAAETLDFSEPVAVMLVAILHFFPHADDPFGIVGRLMGAAAPGSFLVVSHGASDIDADNMALLTKRLSEGSHETFVWRPQSDVARFFDGLELIDPGVVPVDEWRPNNGTDRGVDWTIPFYGGIGAKR
jgi:hypothetical protein